MARYKVAVVNLGYECYHIEREILEPVGAELILTPKDCLTEEDVIDVARDADAILVREAPIRGRSWIPSTAARSLFAMGSGLTILTLKPQRKKDLCGEHPWLWDRRSFGPCSCVTPCLHTEPFGSGQKFAAGEI